MYLYLWIIIYDIWILFIIGYFGFVGVIKNVIIVGGG